MLPVPVPIMTTAVLITSGPRPPGKRGKGYAAMRKAFREMFDVNIRSERSIPRVIAACIEDREANWSDRLQACEFADKYGFGMPERLDEEQVTILAERRMEQRIAEARAALGPVDVDPVEARAAELGVLQQPNREAQKAGVK